MNDLLNDYLLVYGAVSLAVGIAIGAWKGRVFAAIVWSLFLGPLGWIIMALGPNMTAKKSADCPHCGGVVPINQLICNHCNNRVLWIKGTARKPSRVAA